MSTPKKMFLGSDRKEDQVVSSYDQGNFSPKSDTSER